MAKSDKVTINDTTPTLLYSGDGMVQMHCSDPDLLLLGGSTVSQANGMPFNFLAQQFFRMTSDDDIYGLLKTPNAGNLTSMDVLVFSYR